MQQNTQGKMIKLLMVTRDKKRDLEKQERNRSACTQVMVQNTNDHTNKFTGENNLIPFDPNKQYDEAASNRLTLYAPPLMYETPRTMPKHMYTIVTDASQNSKGIISHNDHSSERGIDRQFTHSNQRIPENRHNNTYFG